MSKQTLILHGRLAKSCEHYCLLEHHKYPEYSIYSQKQSKGNETNAECYKACHRCVAYTLLQLLIQCRRIAMVVYDKVQVGKDQEKAQSEKDSHSKNRGGKKPNQQSGTYTMKKSQAEWAACFSLPSPPNTQETHQWRRDAQLSITDLDCFDR